MTDPVVAADKFAYFNKSFDTPGTKAFAITPSDTDELAYITRWLYVGAAGDVTVILEDDTTEVLLKAVPAGTILPIRVRQVKDTGTDGSLYLVGIY